MASLLYEGEKRCLSPIYPLEGKTLPRTGMTFRAGQYVWLTITETLFTLQQHPFLFRMSEAAPERIEFGI